MKKFLSAIALLLAVCALSFCVISCEETEKDKAYYDHEGSNTGSGVGIRTLYVEREVNSMQASDFVASEVESDYVLIRVKDYGEIVVVLRSDVAPKSVANFKKLTAEKFYDGTVFHRVVKGFMIQGGGNTVEVSEDGKDTTFVEKDAASIKGEFASNGFENNLKHVRGVLSMARTGIKDSASSQFFIIHEDSHHLDGDYAAFGYVLAGMDVVDAIAECEVIGADTDAPIPFENIIIESAFFVEPK